MVQSHFALNSSPGGIFDIQRHHHHQKGMLPMPDMEKKGGLPFFQVTQVVMYAMISSGMRNALCKCPFIFPISLVFMSLLASSGLFVLILPYQIGFGCVPNAIQYMYKMTYMFVHQ